MDVNQAHTLTAQILSAYLPEKGHVLKTSKGIEVGEYLGNVYKELFKSIIEADQQHSQKR